MCSSKKIFCTAITAAVLFFGAAAYGLAGTYYVSPSGTAAWGTGCLRTAPCSVTTAMNNVQADGVVIFLDGTYNVGYRKNTTGGGGGSTYEHCAVEPLYSGTSGHPITFKAENQWGAILVGTNKYPYDDPGDAYEASVIGAYNRDWIVIDGFDIKAVDSQSGKPIIAKSSFRASADHNTLQNCKLNGVESAAPHTFNVGAVRIQDSSFNTIKNNYITGYKRPAGTTDQNYTGFCGYSAYDTIVEYNTFYNCTTAIYDKENGQRNTFRYNLVDTGNIGFIAQSETSIIRDHKIHNNIFTNLAYGIFFFSGDGYTRDNYQIYNNIIYNTSCAIQYSHYADATKGWQFWNNIISNSGTALNGSATGGNPTYSDYNIYYSGQRFVAAVGGTYNTLTAWQGSNALVGGGRPDTHSYYEDPKFANAGGHNATDYISAATHVNNGRGGAYASAIGAYVTGSEQIGYSGTGGNELVRPPSGLRVMP